MEEESIVIAPEERHEFDEFKRQKRVTEARNVIRKIELDFTQPQAERAQLRRAIKDAEKLGLGGICVTPYLVKPCADFLGVNSDMAVVACLKGGSDVTDIKVKQVKRAIKDGADVTEVTVPIAAVKEGSWGYVKRECKKLVKAAKKISLRLNVEAPLLTSEELTRLCMLACECGVLCIRTASDGYGSGADEEDLKVIKAAVKDKATIKADGADAAGRMSALCDLGATIVSSSAALTLAQSILTLAER